MFKTITTTLAMTALVTIGIPAIAQGNSQGKSQNQSSSKSTISPQSAGGFGTTSMWGYVAADGTHTSGTGGSALANTGRVGAGPGSYEVIFKRGVHNNCYFGGTIANQTLGITPGFIDVARRDLNTKGVYVQTRDDTGNLADRDFMIYVYCYR